MFTSPLSLRLRQAGSCDIQSRVAAMLSARPGGRLSGVLRRSRRRSRAPRGLDTASVVRSNPAIRGRQQSTRFVQLAGHCRRLDRLAYSEGSWRSPSAAAVIIRRRSETSVASSPRSAPARRPATADMQLRGAQAGVGGLRRSLEVVRMCCARRVTRRRRARLRGISASNRGPARPARRRALTSAVKEPARYSHGVRRRTRGALIAAGVIV